MSKLRFKMPRRTKKRKAAIEREKRKKINLGNSVEDVWDTGYIRESSLWSTELFVPDIKEECVPTEFTHDDEGPVIPSSLRTSGKLLS